MNMTPGPFSPGHLARTRAVRNCVAATAAFVGVALASTAMAFPIDMRIFTGANQGWLSYGVDATHPVLPADPANGGHNANNWASNEYDDSGWAAARVPYPNPRPPEDFIPAASCGPGCTPTQAQFMWHDPAGTSDGATGVTNAYFRKEFFLPVGSDTLPLQAIARIQVDDDFQFFVNGNSVYLNADQGNAGNVYTLDFSQYLLQNASNVIAIHAVDGGWPNGYPRGYEDVLMDARIRTVDESGGMALLGLALVGLTATRRGKPRHAGDAPSPGPIGQETGRG
jgi:hypothetical protein